MTSEVFVIITFSFFVTAVLSALIAVLSAMFAAVVASPIFGLQVCTWYGGLTTLVLGWKNSAFCHVDQSLPYKLDKLFGNFAVKGATHWAVPYQHLITTGILLLFSPLEPAVFIMLCRLVVRVHWAVLNRWNVPLEWNGGVEREGKEESKCILYWCQLIFQEKGNQLPPLLPPHLPISTGKQCLSPAI